MDTIISLFSYPFFIRALIVGLLVSLCAAMLGVSLVLKRYSMIGDGLSHVSFGALAIAAALNTAPLAVSVPIVILAAFLMLRLTEKSTIGGDSAIAVFSSAALATGIIVTSLPSGINIDIRNYMFGSILAMNQSDVYISIILSLIVIVVYVLFHNRIFAITFDENFSRATGVKVDLYNMTLAALTAITIVLGMRIMGALLISSLIIFPALSAMHICRYFKRVIVMSAVISVFCFLAGLTASYLLELPVGASVVAVNFVIFIVCWVISYAKRGNN